MVASVPQFSLGDDGNTTIGTEAATQALRPSVPATWVPHIVDTEHGSD